MSPIEASAFPPFDTFLQTIADLVYCGERGSIPMVVPSRLVTLHPSNDITFMVTCPEWKALLGWGPDACVEIQVHPFPEVPEVRKTDCFYWMHRSTPSRP